MRHLFLGYDLRYPAGPPLDRRWTPELRRRFLLDETVAWPKSVDRLVWPSLFQWHDAAPNPSVGGHLPRPRATPFERHTGFWSDVDTMMAAGKAGGVAGPVSVAISLVAAEGAAPDGAWTTLRDLGPPDGPPMDWRLLGYDVADQGTISGLSNCGYTDTEKAALVARWRGGLNGHGLFARCRDADGFRAASDARVPEHAPFLVFALRAAPGTPALSV